MTVKVGVIYVPHKPPGFITVASVLGPIHLSAYRDLKPMEFSVRRNQPLECLNLPMVAYDIMNSKSDEVVGVGFQFHGKPSLMHGGLLMRHSMKPGESSMVYKDDNVIVFHAVNCFTLITRAWAPARVEDTLLAL